MEYLEVFIDRMAVERNLAVRTRRAYRCDVGGLLRWGCEQEKRVLDEDMIRAYFDWLQRERKLCATTIVRKYISVRQYCRFLWREGRLERMFLEFSTRKYKQPKRLPKTISQGEIVRLIRHVTEDVERAPSDYRRRLAIRNACMLELLYSLGLRIGEVAALNVEDYDEREYSMLVHGKGDKERMLYISAAPVREKLLNWLDVRREMCREAGERALFLNRYGERMGIYGIEKMFYGYRDATGINGEATPHFLRHSFATQMLDNGAGIREVQELLGHSSIMTTQIYTEVSLQRKKQVLERYNARNFMDI